MKKYVVPNFDILVIDIMDEVSSDSTNILSNPQGATSGEKEFDFGNMGGNTVITPIEGSGYNNKGF